MWMRVSFQAKFGHNSALFSELAFVTQDVVVVLCEAVSLVANILQQPQSESMAAELERFRLSRKKDLFVAFSQR